MFQPRSSVLCRQLFVASLVLFLVANTINLYVTTLQPSVQPLPSVQPTRHHAVQPLPSVQPTRHHATLPPPSTSCTRDQLLALRAQLHPIDCVKALRSPWLQSCSLTARTKCPDPANWLEEYYSELQREYAGGGEFASPFLAMSVGCNKGFDALNTLRMGTFDASLSKSDWNDAMTAGEENLHQSVCNQDATPEFEIIGQPSSGQVRRGEVHCFEPMPSTYQKLHDSAKSLGYDEKGYKVVHSAVSKEEGMAYLPSRAKIGIENVGLDQACGNAAIADGHCEAVHVLTLEKYVKEHVDGDGPIHMLQIDVEGYDGDVMLGAGDEVLGRVEYLEFEYNWMGSWRTQHLYDMVEMLNERDFSCYWAGRRRLWRITGCWMQYFDVHTWSNVACVNRSRVPRLASKMEAVFQKTLEEGTPVKEADEIGGHEILSTDAAQMALKYLS